MEETNVWKKSIQVFGRDWRIWLVLLLSTSADIFAVLTVSRNWVDMRWPSFVLLFLAMFGEGLVIRMLGGQMQGKPHRFAEDLSAVFSSLPRIIGAKILLFIIPMAYYAVFILFAVLITSYVPVQATFIGLFIPLLLFVEIWNYYTCTIILVQNFSATDSLSLGMQVAWSTKWKTLRRMLPFIFVEMVAIGLLIMTRSITHDSAFIFTVTREMAFTNSEQIISSFKMTVAGDYFVLNRIMNGLVTSLVKLNGIDMLSISFYAVRNWIAGLIVILCSIPLTGLKMSIITSTYLESAGDSISLAQENWKRKEELMRASRRL